jgi:HEAT repeat protein
VLVAILDNPTAPDNVRSRAAQTLAQIKAVNPEVISALWKYWGGEETTLSKRRSAAYALRVLGQDVSEIVQALVTITQDPRQDARRHRSAIYTIGELGIPTPAVVNALTEQIASQSDDSLWKEAVTALCKLTPVTSEIIGVVHQAVSLSPGDNDSWRSLWDMCQRYEEKKAADVLSNLD